MPFFTANQIALDVEVDSVDTSYKIFIFALTSEGFSTADRQFNPHNVSLSHRNSLTGTRISARQLMATIDSLSISI